MTARWSIVVAALGLLMLGSAPNDATLTVPDDYQTEYVLIGSWSIADEDKAGAAGFHQVYTQPETVRYYRQHGEFPEGAVLVKELRKASTQKLTTGTASFSTDIDGWFVMVKGDNKSTTDDPLWGDGWGWAYFGADDPKTTTTENYRTECIACHLPAKSDDWVYVSGYPILRGE